LFKSLDLFRIFEAAHYFLDKTISLEFVRMYEFITLKQTVKQIIGGCTYGIPHVDVHISLMGYNGVCLKFIKEKFHLIIHVSSTNPSMENLYELHYFVNGIKKRSIQNLTEYQLSKYIDSLFKEINNL